jgi:cardiolipin synthase
MKLNFHFFRTLPAHEKKITFSTILTIIRIILVPFIMSAMILHAWDSAFWLFIIAALSDVFDGWCARWLNERTFLGACLDPLADKLLILAVFTTLAFVQSPLFSIPLWFVLLVLIKEMILIIGSIFIFARQGHLTVRSLFWGKAAMAAQTSFIIWLFSCYFFHWVPIRTYYAMLTGVLCISFLALLQYMRIGLRQILYI